MNLYEYLIIICAEQTELFPGIKKSDETRKNLTIQGI
jgi:hypothetical protein